MTRPQRKPPRRDAPRTPDQAPRPSRTAPRSCPRRPTRSPAAELVHLPHRHQHVIDPSRAPRAPNAPSRPGHQLVAQQQHELVEALRRLGQARARASRTSQRTPPSSPRTSRSSPAPDRGCSADTADTHPRPAPARTRRRGRSNSQDRLADERGSQRNPGPATVHSPARTSRSHPVRTEPPTHRTRTDSAAHDRGHGATGAGLRPTEKLAGGLGAVDELPQPRDRLLGLARVAVVDP